MGELILCKKPIAAAPFYLESISLNIYSIEELCYVVSAHTDILEKDFVSDDLLRWLSDEAGYMELSLYLRKGRETDTPLHVQIETILRSCGYLTPKEIKDTVREVQLQAGLSPVEKKKKRADILLKKGNIRKAVTAYRRILASEEMERGIYGGICHNIGYAYAKLFLFEEAAGWYRRAYEHNMSIKSLMQLLFCLMETGDEEAIEEIRDTYHVKDEELKRARAVFEAAGETRKVKEAQAKVGRDSAALHGAVASLKSDYIRRYGA